MSVCTTTAQFPGFSIDRVLAHMDQGVSEGLWGALSTRHVQLCPQSAGQITEERAESWRAQYPHMQLRLHANAHVLPKHMLWDISSWDDTTLPYFVALADRSKRLGARAISLHAGYQNQCRSDQVLSNRHHIQDLFDRITQGRVRVAIEGLYPNKNRPQWVDTWQAYEQVWTSGAPYAIDLSHLNIVAHHDTGWDEAMVRDLLTSPQCEEIHVSSNNGHSDQHHVLTHKPAWWAFWEMCSEQLPSDTVVFSEGNLTRLGSGFSGLV